LKFWALVGVLLEIKALPRFGLGLAVQRSASLIRNYGMSEFFGFIKKMSGVPASLACAFRLLSD